MYVAPRTYLTYYHRSAHRAPCDAPARLVRLRGGLLRGAPPIEEGQLELHHAHVERPEPRHSLVTRIRSVPVEKGLEPRRKLLEAVVRVGGDPLAVRVGQRHSSIPRLGLCVELLAQIRVQPHAWDHGCGTRRDALVRAAGHLHEEVDVLTAGGCGRHTGDVDTPP
eukprot:scaffold7622_cov130-Isochrysis_galbana.AAC.3